MELEVELAICSGTLKITLARWPELDISSATAQAAAPGTALFNRQTRFIDGLTTIFDEEIFAK